jgi:hypothetical protein
MASARHIVLTGVHPYERMLSLPGPRGWLPCTLFLIAAICMPVWVSFHSGVLGNMVSWLTGNEHIVTSPEELAQVAEDPQVKKQVSLAFAEAAEALGLGRERAVGPGVRSLATPAAAI